MAFDGVEIGFAVPVLGLSAKSKWRPDPAAKDAAWAIYVEMATRIAIAGLSEGHLREAITSYHNLFVEVRGILRQGGPSLAAGGGADEPSLATLVLWMLNGEIRPVVSCWHVALGEHDARRPPSTWSPRTKRPWAEFGDYVMALNALSERLLLYARLFERACGITRSPIPGAGA
jgi:hypothetical protein